MAEGGLLTVGEIVAHRYRIERLIGEGGFGQVYRAVQLTTDQAVAVKVLRQHVDDAGRQRFEREARLARQLSHPNTVRLMDFGQTNGALPFIIFEFLSGESLGALLRRQGALPSSRVAHIASQVLRSLMEAHALGIVHRDIKPANVFICNYAGSPDFVKVLDFGIAKRDSPHTKVLTSEGEVVGTPAYMAPEHIAGRPPISGSDLYSLGIVMAELLGGSRIYRGDPMSICLEQLSERPVPLPHAALEPPLGAIVQRAVQKDLAYRYASAADMLRDVETALRISDAPSAPNPSEQTTWRRPPGPVPLSAPATNLTSAPTLPPLYHHHPTRSGSITALRPCPPSSSPAPPKASVYPASRRRTLLTYVVAGGLLCLGAVAALGGAYLLHQAVLFAATARPWASAGAPATSAQAGEFDGIDYALIEQRAQHAGYESLSGSNHDSRIEMQVLAKKRDLVGVIVLATLDSAWAAQTLCRKAQVTCVASGRRALWVRLGNVASERRDPAAERSLLNAIVHGP